MPFTNCSTVKLLKTFLMPSVLLIVFAAIQCNATFTFNLDLPTPPKAAANACTQCSPPSRSPVGLTESPNTPVPGVDANGCSTLVFECPNIYPGSINLIKFNGSQVIPGHNKATLTCNANGKFEFQPQPETGMANMEVTEVHCQVTLKMAK